MATKSAKASVPTINERDAVAVRNVMAKRKDNPDIPLLQIVKREVGLSDDVALLRVYQKCRRIVIWSV